MNEKQILDIFENAINKVLPRILRNTNNSIRVGIIRNVDTSTRTAEIYIIGTGEIINGMKYISNMDPHPNNNCLIISADPMVKATNYALIFN